MLSFLSLCLSALLFLSFSLLLSHLAPFYSWTFCCSPLAVVRSISHLKTLPRKAFLYLLSSSAVLYFFWNLPYLYLEISICFCWQPHYWKLIFTISFCRASSISSDFCCSASPCCVTEFKGNLEKFVRKKCSEILSIWFVKEEPSKKTLNLVLSNTQMFLWVGFSASFCLLMMAFLDGLS